jgi:hypothetical protein
MPCSWRKRRLRDALSESWSLHQFHHEGCRASRSLEAVNRGDVRVVQRSEHFGFALKSRKALPVLSNRLRQDLEGDRSFEIRVGRSIDLAHAARADCRLDLVRTKSGTEL